MGSVTKLSVQVTGPAAILARMQLSAENTVQCMCVSARYKIDREQRLRELNAECLLEMMRQGLIVEIDRANATVENLLGAA